MQAGADTPDWQVLVPGQTCWRMARARRVAVIVDAAEYFARLKQAVLAARHSVLLIGWDFDTRIKLEVDAPRTDAPNELGDFLAWVVRERPGLTICVLKWDLSFLKVPLRGQWPMFLLNWFSSRRLRFRLDSAHPPGACHHQKIAVIDDALAFCGGIDMTIDRWDTSEHQDDDPRRVRPSGEPYGPFHDVTAAVDGAAARALGDLARERWRRATGERLRAPPPVADLWPAELSPAFEHVDVGIARTDPGGAQTGGAPVREIEALYLSAIAAARRFVYLETQYFASPRIAAAVAQRLGEPDGPEFIVVNPVAAEGWLEEKAMGGARTVLLERMAAADRHGRFRLLTPQTAGGDDIYVHAKVLVVDDRLLRVGSSNINNRSMGFDTECDLVLETGPGTAGSAEMRDRIQGVRRRLLSEHLGVAVTDLATAEAAAGGSVLRAVDALRRPAGRTLRPLQPKPLDATERALVEQGLLDPDRPESMAKTMARGLGVMAHSQPPLAPIAITGAGLALLGWAMRWMWRRPGPRTTRPPGRL